MALCPLTSPTLWSANYCNQLCAASDHNDCLLAQTLLSLSGPHGLQTAHAVLGSDMARQLWARLGERALFGLGAYADDEEDTKRVLQFALPDHPVLHVLQQCTQSGATSAPHVPSDNSSG